MSNAVNKRTAVGSLLRKGFLRETTDHEKYFFHAGGLRTSLWAKVSFRAGSSDLYPHELKGMKFTLRLGSLGQVKNLLLCKMTAEEFAAHYRALPPAR